MTIFLTSSVLPDERGVSSIGGDEWGMSGNDGGGMGRDERSGVYNRGGVDDGGGDGGTVHHRAAVVADGGGNAAHDGTAVNSRSQVSGTSGGNGQKSGQHHQFEHFVCRSVLCCGQTGLKKTMAIRAFYTQEAGTVARSGSGFGRKNRNENVALAQTEKVIINILFNKVVNKV
ncbi:hypothetical protein TcasGA2_TC008557 [Tribolium castaneum]|uniref:Uncharacterized protein n=1 Tax=Tribolium castaneum TaxID=7070 RepID=D7ELA4_TRICA|nr:hypothetical protein TcasGA2_TC008557 [Tribolium castaneum]